MRAATLPFRFERASTSNGDHNLDYYRSFTGGGLRLCEQEQKHGQHRYSLHHFAYPSLAVSATADLYDPRQEGSEVADPDAMPWVKPATPTDAVGGSGAPRDRARDRSR